MAKTFRQMVDEAKAETAAISPQEAHQNLRDDPDALLIEVRDAASVPESEQAPDVAFVSLGTLPIRADLEVPEGARDPRLQDRSRRIVMTCRLGNMAAMGAKVLTDMGFTNVAYMDPGFSGWKEQGLPYVIPESK